MMGRSHLAVNGALVATGLTWLNVLRDQTSSPAVLADTWVTSTVSGLMSITGAGVPAWIGDHFVSGSSQKLWTWFFPFVTPPDSASARAALIAYLVLAAVLLIVGTLAPDADSKSSLVSQRLPFSMPGPHRGILHTDWVLIGLLALSSAQPMRALIWLWLGAWLHCEVDGLSTAGRARFYPLMKYRIIVLGGGETCVGQMGYRVALYSSGKTGEFLMLAAILLGSGVAIFYALHL
jgi:hypothetical protein